MSKKLQNSTVVVACFDQGADNDPKALGLAFHHQGPTFINPLCHRHKVMSMQVGWKVDGGTDE